MRYIGVSNFSVGELEESVHALKSQTIVSNQIEYGLHSREAEREIIPYCEREGITIVAYTPIWRGRILDEVANPRSRRGAVLMELAGSYGRTPIQVALNWVVWRENVVTIPKSANKRHLEENRGAVGWRLSENDYRTLSEAWR
ncbi:MAG: aldo/keto reductase [Nitrososphaerota archaeon]